MSWRIAKHPAASENNSSYFEPRYFKRRTIFCRRTKAIGRQCGEISRPIISLYKRKISYQLFYQIREILSK